LGIRLLHRTTRSVTPTEAGARMLDRLGPALDVLASGCDAGIRYDEWLEGDMIALPIGPHSISLRCKLHYSGSNILRFMSIREC
jgi:hypothetical protein